MTMTWTTRPRVLALLACMAALASASAPVSAQSSRERERARAERERARERRSDRHDRDDEDSDDRHARTSIDTTITFDRTGVVELTLMSGEVVVTAWDRNEAKIRATSERARLETDLSRSRLSISEHGDQRGHGDTRYEVTVPIGARVITHSLSGDLTIRGVRGEVEAYTTSGTVIVDDAASHVRLESVSGDITATHIAGDVRAHSTSGTVEVDGGDSEVEAETTSGDIRITNSRARYVRAGTVSGEIEFTGAIDRTGRYEFHSHSGDVDVDLPTGVAAFLSVETYSGDIDTEFPMTLTPDQRDRSSGHSRRFEFTLGGGGARISLESFSGDVTIRRARSDR